MLVGHYRKIFIGDLLALNEKDRRIRHQSIISLFISPGQG